MKNEILALLNERHDKPDGWLTLVKSRPQYWDWVCQHTSDTLSNSARLYCALHNLPDAPVCACASGKRVTFLSIVKGFTEFCPGKCPKKFEVQTERRVKKLNENGGVGLANPASKRKAHTTVRDRYDVDNVGQRQEHRALMRDENPMFLQVNKDKCKAGVRSKYGVDNAAQIHMAQPLQDGLFTKESLTNMWSTKNVYEIAAALGVAYTTVHRYLNSLNIKQPFFSGPEIQIGEYVQNILQISDCLLRRRTIIRPYELDLYSPSNKIAIEHCGLMWHGERNFERTTFDKHRHQKKLKMCESLGIRLLTIFEDEWLSHREICEHRIAAAFGVAPRGKGARELMVQRIKSPIACNFLRTHHLQGVAPARYHYGAFDGDDLIAVMTFSGDVHCNLERWTTNGKIYPGLASKIFVAFVRDHAPKTVETFCDLRWGTGNVYVKMGFELVSTSLGFWYFKNQFTRYHREGFWKDKLIAKGADASKKQWEMAQQLGYDRIWDCGQDKYVWKAS